MKKFAFRPFQPSKDTEKAQKAQKSPSNVTPTSYLKRREQVRKAQRTHRERKEVYIKSLETEVLQLRTNEANILQETQNLYAEIGRLKKILTEHGIQVPLGDVGSSANAAFQAPLNYEPDVFSTNSVVSIRENSHKGRQIHVQKATTDPRHHDVEFYLSESSTDPLAGSRKRDFFRKEDRKASDTSSKAHSPSSAETLSRPDVYSALLPARGLESMAELDITNIGIEFVLTLESPCLGHTQGNPKEPSAPTGHALTASAPLLLRAPNPAPTSQLYTPASWEAPNVGLERLLNLSQNLDLEDEVTPVHAWNYIRRHPAFEGIEIERLRTLTGKLLKEVTCYGFGAVVEQGIFENIVFDALVVGQVF